MAVAQAAYAFKASDEQHLRQRKETKLKTSDAAATITKRFKKVKEEKNSQSAVGMKTKQYLSALSPSRRPQQ